MIRSATPAVKVQQAPTPGRKARERRGTRRVNYLEVIQPLGMDKKCLENDLRSSNSLLLLDTLLPLLPPDQCQGAAEDHFCIKKQKFHVNFVSGGSGQPPPTWSPCAR